MKGVYRPPSSLVKTCLSALSPEEDSKADIDLRLELLDALDGPRGDEHLSSSDLLTLDTTEQSTHVVTSLAALELFVEHL